MAASWFAVLDERDIVYDLTYADMSGTSVYIPIPSEDRTLIGKWYNRETQTFETAPFHLVAKHSTDEINVGTSDVSLTSMLESLSASVGSFTGNGSASRTIELGFTPKFVFVSRNDGVTNDSTSVYGGLAVTGSNCISGEEKAIEIVENGFVVYRATGVNVNMSTKVYNYIAM